MLPSDRHVLAALAVPLLLVSGLPQPGPSPPDLAAQEAEASDVGTPEAIVSAVYDLISGPAGEERDWDRFRALFRPEGRLVPTGRGPGGEAGYQVLTVEEYVENASRAFAKRGFFEREISSEIQRFGDVAHVFSTYASRRSPDDPEPFQRGINSFQLWHDGDRWWILHVVWHAEREGAPIPGD